MAGEPAAGGEIQHPPAGDEVGMIEEMAGQGLAAGPGEGPIGRGQAVALEIGLGRMPDGQDLAREIKLDLGHQRRGGQRGFGADEDSGIAHPVSRPARTRPRMMPMKRIQPSQRLARNLARQSAGSSKSTAKICQAR